MRSYKNCQSCGMPIKKDPQGGGTNSDGGKSEMYCSYCYVNGAFKNADWTVEEMQIFCKKKLQEMGFPGFLAGWLTKGIPNLERWKKK
jgi:hypothetical protein